MKSPLLISLPHGLNASGVTTWAVRLANGLARSGRACGLVVHDEPPGQRALPLAIEPVVEVFDARCLPPLDRCAGDLSCFLPVYRLAVGVLAARSGGGPVVCSPNLVGDSYGVFAHLSREIPHLVRAIAVHHSDIRYNDCVCAHYEPMLAAFVGVSEHIAGRLGAMLPGRAADVHEISYGVELPTALPARAPIAGRPLRLLYAGRIDHEQKRIGALVFLSDELRRRAIPHELALLGDGPAAPEIDAICAGRPTIRRYPATDPGGVTGALEAADFFVLASRYEGLSVALLEALARGCTPVLTPTASGTEQLVRDGETGFVAAAGPDAQPASAGLALAEAVIRAVGSGDRALADIRAAGWEIVRSRFSVELCASRYGALLDAAADGPARPWPRDRPAAFTGAGSGGSGTVPADAPALLERLLGSLAGGRVAVYGTGRHTEELERTLLSAPVELAAFIDDDPARWGRTLWGLPVLPPDRAHETGATDVVISSWLHEDAIWGRRALESRGLRVHRIYAVPALTPAQAGLPPRPPARAATPSA